MEYVLLLCFTSYHVGNSLTQDSVGNLPPGPIDPLRIEALATSAGFSLEAGYHHDSGQPLHIIWDDPNGYNFLDEGPWNEQLPLPHDIVTLQPHINGGSTLGTDVEAIDNFITYANSNRFYVLQTWTDKTTWPYTTYWDAPVVDDLSTPTTKQRDYFDHLMNRLNDVWMIPTGEVFYELEQAGYDLNDFYRDDVHLELNLGRWVAGVTVASTMLQYDPRDKPIPPPFTLSEEEVDPIDKIIWNVISSHRWSGYSDFNWDGKIDQADLKEWESSGRDGNDFLAWQRQITSSAQVLVIPEPNYLALFFCFLLTRRSFQ